MRTMISYDLLIEDNFQKLCLQQLKYDKRYRIPPQGRKKQFDSLWTLVIRVVATTTIKRVRFNYMTPKWNKNNYTMQMLIRKGKLIKKILSINMQEVLAYQMVMRLMKNIQKRKDTPVVRIYLIMKQTLKERMNQSTLVKKICRKLMHSCKYSHDYKN